MESLGYMHPVPRTLYLFKILIPPPLIPIQAQMKSRPNAAPNRPAFLCV